MRSLITRSICTARILGFCLGLLLAVTAAAAGPTDPRNSVRDFYDTLLTAMKDGPRLGQSGRYTILLPVIGSLFDVPLMARIAVGPSWVTLSPDQRQQITEAFGRYISATYADRFDSYSGEQLQIIGDQPYGMEIIVQTRIVKSNGEIVRLDYRMHENAGSWRVSDVYLDESISQLATQRSEFHSIVQRQGVDGLLMALSRKVDLLTRKFAKSS